MDSNKVQDPRKDWTDAEWEAYNQHLAEEYEQEELLKEQILQEMEAEAG